MDKKKNEGINCSVSDCMFHEGVSSCVADKVQVGPCNACTSGETVCETFRKSNR